MRNLFKTARRLSIGLGGWLLILLPSAAQTAEVIMVEQGGCYSCVRFEQEQGDVFDLWFGNELILRRVDIHGRWPYRSSRVRRPMGTPTFIVMEEGEEIGRFAGYGDDRLFWKRLQAVLAKR